MHGVSLCILPGRCPGKIPQAMVFVMQTDFQKGSRQLVWQLKQRCDPSRFIVLQRAILQLLLGRLSVLMISHERTKSILQST